MLEGSHVGPVTDLSVCSTRPLFASASSSDNMVLVWNYQSRKVLARRPFPMPPLSVSFHPSGLFLLVTTASRVYFVGIVRSELTDLADIGFVGARGGSFSSDGGKFGVIANKQVRARWCGQIVWATVLPAPRTVFF